jgi:hypothetical protein
MCKNIKLILSLALFVLFSGAVSLSGQSTIPLTEMPTQESKPLNQGLMLIATGLQADSMTLTQRLETRKAQEQRQIEYWQNIVSRLQKEKEQGKKESMESLAKLAEAQAELSKSQTALAETSKLLAETKADVVSLSKDFGDYKQANEAKIAKQAVEIMVYRGIAIGVTIVGAVGCGYLGGKIAGLW